MAIFLSMKWLLPFILMLAAAEAAAQGFPSRLLVMVVCARVKIGLAQERWADRIHRSLLA